MSLQTEVVPGSQLGPYRIEAALGAGGMGEVFRATDTRLGRSVAIKICGQQFQGRFDREAQAIAALNHPHICTLYDIGPNYLVMELVTGETLAARVRNGPLPIEVVLRYAIEMAGALVAAHTNGIVHRDLKPANIMVTNSGIKVLDFGLAKLTAVPGVAGGKAETMTVSRAVLGTVPYMAPEQLEGKECDARSDIFSLGLVVYEMATGKRAFDGTALDPLPVKFAHVLQRCLAKDPDNRWQTARDLKAELEWAAAYDASEHRTVPRRALLPWIAGAAAAGAGAAGLAVWSWGRSGSPAPTRAIRFRLAALDGAWRERVISRQSLAVSPVGGRVAMIATGGRGPMMWVQRLDSLTATPLPGTEGPTGVFWSPDGRFIGFWADGKLKKIPAEGGTALPMCELPSLWSATWNQNGIIVAESPRAVICNVSVDSGSISSGRPGLWPRFLPDGKHFLYVKHDPSIRGNRAYAAEWSGGRETALMPTDSYVMFVPDHTGTRTRRGHLMFVRGGTLLAQSFDADRLSISGEPMPVAQGIPFFLPRAWAEFDASNDGVLVYSTGSEKSQLTWLDRAGREAGRVGIPQAFWQVLRISPDGRKVIADVSDWATGGSDIWAFDIAQGTAERVTFETGSESWPIWSPDGTRIAYGSAQGGPPQIKVKSLSDHGAGEGFQAAPFQLPIDWSPDGRWILYQTQGGGDSTGAIWIASLADRKITLLINNAAFPSLSPRGDYLAFAGADTGRSEVYTQAFRTDGLPKVVGERQRVSRDGGNVPRWRRDGKELFFLSPEPERQIMAVPVQQGGSSGMEFGSPRVLFRLPISTFSAGNAGYEVSPDGQKFLVPIRQGNSAALEVVIDWQAGLGL